MCFTGTKNAELTAKLNWYEEQFRLSQQKRFGSSSEKTNPDQLTLFNEAEFEAKPELPEPTVETITYSRRKKEKGQRETVLKDLPVETIEYHLTDEEKVCSACGNHLHVMSTEVRQEFKVIPPQVKLVKHIRHVYSCRYCEREGISTPVVTAPMPAPALPGSLASPFGTGLHYEPKICGGTASLPPGAAVSASWDPVIPPNDG